MAEAPVGRRGGVLVAGESVEIEEVDDEAPVFAFEGESGTLP